MSYPKYALVFAFDKEKLIPITMWFCFIPLDLIFLDAKFKVVEKKENITPWENYFPKKKAKYVIELSTGSSEKIRIGDILSISNIKLS